MNIPHKYEKLLLSYFSCGNLKELKSKYSTYDNIFDHVPRKGNSIFYRLVFYAFLNSQFEIIEWYLDISESPARLSSREVYVLSHKISSKNRFINWIDKCNKDERLKEFVNYELLIESLKNIMVRNYNYDSIEKFIEVFPDEIENLVKMCSSTQKGKQLKRHIKLMQIV
jgi:hypothetical protein